ncbi:MAG TPA: tetratricopeptide repeat protein [Planctomycetota bacterium]|nr:tetratricopeptide repeat protein [Planctomycetota bacterium]
MNPGSDHAQLSPVSRRIRSLPPTVLLFLAALLIVLPAAGAAAPRGAAEDPEVEENDDGKAKKDGDTKDDDEDDAAGEKDAPRGPGGDLRTGGYEEAIEGFQKLLQSDPGSVPAAIGLSRAFLAIGKTGDALRALDGVKDASASAPLLAARGRVHLVKGSLAEAEAAFRAALGAEPGNVEALNRLGETLSKRGKLEEATASWQKIVQVYEAMSVEDAERLAPEAFVEMGLALVGLNRFKEAHEVMFSSARDKDPKDPALLLASGRVLKEKYNFPDSRDELREALDQNPRFADALVVLADNYLTDFQVGTKRYELADKSLKKAIEVNPNQAEAYLVRGSLVLSDGNVAGAAADFTKSIELDPSSLRARGLLAACRFLEGDSAQLERVEKEALSLNPRGAEFFHTIALAIENKFRYKESVQYSDRALELDPDYWPAYVTLGINCLRTGEEERGRKFLDRSWAHDKFNVWVFNTRTLLRHMDANYRELKTDRFVFKFPRRDYDELAAHLVPLLEEAYVKLSAHYKVEIPTPIYVEAFSEHKWFSARTVGLEGFAASGACFGNLVTLTTPRALPQNWGAVAWHEFAHVVTLALTKHRVPRWLTEGLSVFEEGRDHPKWTRDFEREIADTLASGRLLPLAELDFGFSKPKYPNQILISYFQGCLIVTHIKEKWGFDAILAILKGYADNKSTAAIFREALGVSLEEFDKGFLDYVTKWVEANGYEPSIAEERLQFLELEAESNPEDVRRLVTLAWAYLTSGNDVDAVSKAGKALELDPANGDAHAILGLDHFRRKNWPRAKDALSKALEGNTRFRFRTHSALGKIALVEGKKEEAIELYEKARAISPRAGAGHPQGRNLYYELADLYTQAGKEDLAIERMEALSRFATEDAKCRERIVSHYMKKDGEDAARKAYEALNDLLFINPFQKVTHEYLARVAAKLGEHDVVIREYSYLLKFPDTNPRVAYLALARAYAARGRAAEAVSNARKVLELDPENEEAKGIIEKHEPAGG